MKYLFIAAILMAGCKEDFTAPSATSSQKNATTTEKTFLTARNSIAPIKFGVYYNANLNKVWAGQALQVGYERMSIILSQYSGFEKVFQTLSDSGFGVLCNVNYYPTSKTTPFVTNLETYRSKLNNLLAKYQPEVVVIENEEENDQYHTGPAQDYVNELRVAVQEGHNHSVKIANGGLNARMVIFSLYRDYLNRGETDSAASLAARAIPPASIRGLTKRGVSPDLETSLAFDSVLLNGYAKLNIDYVNIHFYEPVLYRSSKTDQKIIDTINTATAGVLQEVSNYLTRVTGKPVISNEMGQINSSPSLVTSALQNAMDANLKYCIWYDSQSNGADGAVGLTKKQVVMSNGEAFRDYVSNH